MNSPTPPTALTSPASSDAGLPIAAVERETGLGKDTLRVWERRYGFPRPLRDEHGERLYPPEQVERLHQIRRLMDQGLRPGKLLGASEAEFAALVDILGSAHTYIGVTYFDKALMFSAEGAMEAVLNTRVECARR